MGDPLEPRRPDIASPNGADIVSEYSWSSRSISGDDGGLGYAGYVDGTWQMIEEEVRAGMGMTSPTTGVTGA